MQSLSSTSGKKIQSSNITKMHDLNKNFKFNFKIIQHIIITYSPNKQNDLINEQETS